MARNRHGAYVVRNTCIEDLHAGTYPSSKAGDYSDVKIVSPFGEIPWNKASRISDDEMRELMKEVVDKTYTVLRRLHDPAFVERWSRYSSNMTKKWDTPQLFEKWLMEPVEEER